MRKFILLILMLLILTPLSLKADEKVKIVATIPPLASIAREIAGDRAEVYYIIPTNSDPHQYSLSQGMSRWRRAPICSYRLAQSHL
ncbi:MAG: hypothetical protein DSO07_00330 [Thermoproteota archaeon]|nr:MAG: hypothetical protein DSO07_00330 [Candidatus Korarchaeota archaeon]